jgi:hypothetical protein
MTYDLKARQPQTKKQPQNTKNISAPVKKTTAATAVKTKSTAKAKPAVKTKVETVAVKEEKPNIHTIKAATVIPIPITIIVIAVLFTGMLMAVIISFVNINEYTIQNEALQIKVGKLESQYKEAAFLLEKKNNLREIEKRAKELGMVKLDQLEKEYILIKSEDRIEIIESKKSAQDVVAGIFEDFNKNIKSIVEYIE